MRCFGRCTVSQWPGQSLPDINIVAKASSKACRQENKMAFMPDKFLVLTVAMAFGVACQSSSTSSTPTSGSAASQPTMVRTPEFQPAQVQPAESQPAATSQPAAPAAKPAKACTSVSRDLPLEQRCAQAGASVFRFTNTCRGRCAVVEKPGMMCGEAMSMGCRCPQGQCIDEKTGCCRDIRQ